ncbi:hypothetical protein RJ640_008551 [Escallonia rubra]|uniref:Uncharacterized protein n=1 Tax=Escallonia rubra TaxID=112253 RepID=A0AA88QME0_9ASTE|nr:hypothetical protein RJ640_008551 [Escallonia rubra]
MPKNAGIKSKSRSTRKPLREVTNAAGKNEDRRAGDDALDHLRLVHSHLSSLIHQIDELVVQALKLKVAGKKDRKEVEAFAHILSDMQCSLKVDALAYALTPWAPRLQKALSVPLVESENQLEQSLASKPVHAINVENLKVADSPDQSMSGSLVSPSPLVSWRAGCTTESGRQLFMLTPLPRPKKNSSELHESSKSVFQKITSNATVISGDKNDDLPEGLLKKKTPSEFSDIVAPNDESTLECGLISPSKFVRRDCSTVVMTPCLKMSPPRSCVLLEPISELAHKTNYRARKSTPFPVGVQNSSGSEDSESSSDQVSEHLALKYPDLFGKNSAQELKGGRKVVEESPNWFMSPPKTCILMELPDEKLVTGVASDCQLPRTYCGHDQPKTLTLIEENDIVTKKSCYQVLERTPMVEPESIMQAGKRPGENTLKKELWTRFDAASTRGIHSNLSVLPENETAHKKFLDLLDEAEER